MKFKNTEPSSKEQNHVKKKRTMFKRTEPLSYVLMLRKTFMVKLSLCSSCRADLLLYFKDNCIFMNIVLKKDETCIQLLKEELCPFSNI